MTAINKLLLCLLVLSLVAITPAHSNSVVKVKGTVACLVGKHVTPLSAGATIKPICKVQHQFNPIEIISFPANLNGVVVLVIPRFKKGANVLHYKISRNKAGSPTCNSPLNINNAITGVPVPIFNNFKGLIFIKPFFYTLRV